MTNDPKGPALVNCVNAGFKPAPADAVSGSPDSLRQTEEKTFMGLILGIITGASLLRECRGCRLDGRRDLFDLCGGAKWGRLSRWPGPPA